MLIASSNNFCFTRRSASRYSNSAAPSEARSLFDPVSRDFSLDFDENIFPRELLSPRFDPRFERDSILLFKLLGFE